LIEVVDNDIGPRKSQLRFGTAREYTLWVKKLC